MPNYICILCCIFILSFVKDSAAAAADGKLTLMPPEKDFVIGTGERASFDCSVQASSNTIHPKWIISNGSNILSYHSSANTKAGDAFVLSAKLEFLNFEPRNVGKYVCEFKEQKLELTIYGVDTMKKGDRFEFEMKQSTLECSITPINKAMTSTFGGWFWEDRMSSPLTGSSYDVTPGKLIIFKPMRNYSGTYIAKYTLKMDNLVLNYNCKTVFEASPMILWMPRSVNQDLGRDINITCRVISYPPSVVHWTVDDKELPRNPRFKMFDSDGHKNNQLSITKLSYNDKGKYNCTVVNGVGNSTTKSILLRVKDPFEWKYPLAGLGIQIFIITIIIIICGRREGKLLQDISNPKKK